LSIFCGDGVLGVVERFVYILFGGFGWEEAKKWVLFRKVGFRNIPLPFPWELWELFGERGGRIIF
jgi:hypothetical protein